MASLEPPTPPVAVASAAEGLGLGSSAAPGGRSSTASTAIKSKRWMKWRRAVGLLLLAITVFLWTASNFLASDIFADDTYSKPYLVTYINTSFFIIPLLPILVRRLYKHPEDLRDWWTALWQSSRGKYAMLAGGEVSTNNSSYTDSPRSSHRNQSVDLSEENLLSEGVVDSQELDSKRVVATEPSRSRSTKLTLPQTARLSLEFCILWFVANYFVAACLSYTTVASSTILTSTSSIFTLLFGVLFRVERFSLRKLIAVITALGGVVLISSVDFSGQNSDDEHRGDFPEKSFHEMMVGDILALVSAVLYGLYAVFMKKRIEDETKVNMPIFFGLVGLFNVLLLWPGMIILHYTGIEPFQLPPSWSVSAIVVSNSLASLVSDLAWAYAVLLTSPIVVTVGLSMTIPLSLVGQILLNGQTSSPLYWVGAVAVILSFVFVSSEEEERSPEETIVLGDEQNTAHAETP
ncbi:hypothetical protein LTS14_000572 [Recurvomyces mirabilis]|nr:hypothetical protein LTS14_000572 [Recurvomyces mirabilis]